MLSCNHVCISAGKQTIVRDVSFAPQKGGFTAIIGKNGSGKSTLISALGGLLPYEGSILLGGRELRSLPPRERAQSLALLPQILPIAPVSVRELVGFGRNPYLGVNRRFSPADRDAVEQALHRTGMAPFADRMLPTLSGGERQLAYLSMVLAQDTGLLLLDEPTTHMDMRAEADFLKLLRELCNEGKTLVVILHQLSRAVRYADRLLILDHGRQIFHGTREECLAQDVIEQTFSVRRTVLPDTGDIIFLA